MLPVAEPSRGLAQLASVSMPGAQPKPASYFQGARSEMLEFVPRGAARVLEVGCGAGRFGAEVKRQLSAEVWGIELEPDIARQAATRLDEVRVGDAREEIQRLPSAHFDCVVMNDVLEHVVDPCSVIHDVRRTLTPNGVIVCSIPNVRYWRVLAGLLFDKDWRYATAGVLDATHLRFFTERSIRRMLHELDYEILELRGINETRKRKVRLLRRLSFGWLSDIVYLEHACIARPRPV